jgi:long-subunit acyl-CoA synthetase (AMP-forming)
MSAAAGTIPGAVERAAVTFAGLPALVGDGATITFDELLEQARAAAAALIEAGVAAGDRVAIWGANSDEWATASLAVLFAGATVVPVNTRYTPVEAGDLVARARCRVVLAEGRRDGRSLAEEASTLDGALTVVALGAAGPPGVPSWRDFAAARAASPELERRLAALTPGDVSHVQYTSGTTGAPKGAMLWSSGPGPDRPPSTRCGLGSPGPPSFRPPWSGTCSGCSGCSWWSPRTG